MTDQLSADEIRDALTGGFGGFIRYFDEIGSTNSEASDWAMCGAPEGALVVTNHQTAGRGRWGRSWFSAPGKLLQFSVVLRPDLDPSRHGLLTAGLGVACARAIRATSSLPVRVKWPNDIVMDHRKLAGMLVESSMMAGKITAAVCGIGVNIHLTEDDIPHELTDKASSIALEVGRRGEGSVPLRTELLAAIVDELESLYGSITGDATGLITAASELSSVLGHEVTVRYADGRVVEGRAEALDADGALLLETQHGTSPVTVGEIEQLRAS